MERKINKSYVLAIHGSPIWFVRGSISDTVLQNAFSQFVSDGGLFSRTLKENPAVEQTIDSIGGIGRLGDITFNVSFDKKGKFLSFFAVNRITGTYTKLSSTLKMSDNTIAFESENAFFPNTIVCTPTETILLGNQLNSTTYEIQTRSLFSAFTEGRYPSFQKATLNNGYLYSAEVCLNGHWSHNGRFVCLYEFTTDETGTYSFLERIYVGRIDGITINGLDATIETKSITTILGTSKVVRRLSAKIEKKDTIVVPSTFDIYRADGKVFLSFTKGNEIELYSYVKNFIESSSYWTNSPNVSFLSGNGIILRSLSASFDQTNHVLNQNGFSEINAWFSDFFNIDTVEGGVAKNYGNYFEMFYTSGVLSKYNYVIGAGTSLKVEGIDSSYHNIGDIVYIIVRNNDPVNPREMVYETTFDGTSFYISKGYDTQFNELNDNEIGMAIDTKKATVDYVSFFPMNTDITTAMIATIVSTGESINQGEISTLNFFTSLALPDYIIDLSSFTPIGNIIEIDKTEEYTFADVYEAPLKILGYCIVFQNGKLMLKRHGIIDSSISVYATKENFFDEKIEHNISFYAPLNIIDITYKKANERYIINMADVTGNVGTGNTISLSDEISLHPSNCMYSNTYQYLYWLSVPTTSIVLKASKRLFGLCDFVSIEHPYTISNIGFGIGPVIGVVVSEVNQGYWQYRLLLVGSGQNGALLSPIEIVDSFNDVDTTVYFRNNTVFKPSNNLSIKNILERRKISFLDLYLTFYNENESMDAFCFELFYDQSIGKDAAKLDAEGYKRLKKMDFSKGIFCTICNYKREEQ